MTRLTAVLIGVAAAVLALGPTVAWGQYPTPLRYDLRYTSPTYIPSGTLRYGPPRQPDPYRFGNPLHGNLGVTGNLRLGKSFRGNTPYTASGSQLTESLPSTALSDFRRDSFGIEDIGTGLEYGQTQAYYPDSATVTTPWTAGRRFDAARFRDRVRYLPPNYNVPPTGVAESPGNIFMGPGGWTGLTLEQVRAAGPGGYGLGEPTTTEALLASLRAMSTSGLPEEEGEGQEEAESLKSPYEILRKRFQAEPMNLFSAEPAPEARRQESPYEHTLKLQYAPEATDLDPWVHPPPEEEEPVDEGPARTPQDEAAGGRWATGWARPEPGRSEAADPWAGSGTPVAAGGVEGLPGRPRRRTPPVPSRPASGYGQYVLRGHEALQRGEYGRAESLYAAAASLERDRPAAFFGRVHALLASRIYLQAAAILERGLTRHPEWVQHAPDLEAVYPEKDVFTRIRRDLKREVGGENTRPAYRFLLAYVEFAVGNADAARAHLTRMAEPSEAQKAMLQALGTG